MRTIDNLLRTAGLFFCMSLAACYSEKDSLQDNDVTIHTYKVAVLMHASEQARWEQTAQWALENIAEAQKMQSMMDRVQLELTFMDQDAADITEYMQQIAEDTTVVAIIGPTTSVRAEQMAIELGKREKNSKPMITPAATYVQYQRKFANVPYIWNMSESDITELEVILSDIASIHTVENVKLELLAPDDGTNEVQSDYVEWFSFIAEEYGMEVSGIHLYTSSANLQESVREICGTEMDKGKTILVFAPGVEDDAIMFDTELGRYKEEIESAGDVFFAPRKIYCTDNFVSDRIASVVKHYDYEGVDLYASPESGFIQAYHQRYGRNLMDGEAQFFDALYLISYATTLMQHTGQDLNEAILSVVDGHEGKGYSWLPLDMAHNYKLLAQGITPDIDGVSSSWTFDKNAHASVIGSVYRRWRIDGGQYVTIEYVSTEGSRRSSSAKATWNWTATHMQTFNTDDGSHLTYPALDDRYALLVAGSKGWANYRFQSNVFALYQLLRQHGYDDDHIILICEDDVARHPNNPYPDTLYVSEPGLNVYDSTAIDYRLSDLSPDDIGDILHGRASKHLPKVISADDNDNVFIFWSSHGSPGTLDFGGSQSMTYDHIRNILAETPHRKLLMTVESCYSGGLGKTCEGLPGVLLITAANPYETSHADVWSEQLGVYLSNGFTHGFQNAVYETPAISLRDLYYSLAATTSGSHVKVYNASNYGNVYSESMAEFLTK